MVWLNIRLNAVTVKDFQDFSELGLFGVVVNGRLAVVRVNVNVEHARQAEQIFFDSRRIFLSVTFGGELQAGIAGAFAATAFFAHNPNTSLFSF